MRRLARTRNACSKNWKNLKAALTLNFWHYSFARGHESIKVTPAMKAGISSHIWTWTELLNSQQAKAA
jgi:hypothetical protein